MKSNNVFTYLLYALLGVLLLSVGYLALEKRKEAARKAEELRKDSEQLERSMSDLNSVGDSITATGESAYVGETAGKKTTANSNGIEDEPVATKPSAAKTPTTTTATKPVATTPKTGTTAPTVVADPKKLVAKGGSVAGAKQSIAPSNNGRFLVVVGAFSQIENARTEMEKFVKMGYQDAEVVKYKTDLWRVIAKRCSKRTDAEKYEGDLERHGVDAMIVDGFAK
jgi:cell division septation protein DedD